MLKECTLSVLGRVGCFPVPGCTDVRGTVAVILQGLHEEKLTKDKWADGKEGKQRRTQAAHNNTETIIHGNYTTKAVWWHIASSQPGEEQKATQCSKTEHSAMQHGTTQRRGQEMVWTAVMHLLLVGERSIQSDSQMVQGLRMCSLWSPREDMTLLQEQNWMELDTAHHNAEGIMQTAEVHSTSQCTTALC